jgi:uncharacterized membrane protein HdeD (DUF308 family)
MTSHDVSPGLDESSSSEPPTWVRAALGIILVLAGVFILGDLGLVAEISTVFIGATAIAAGAFEIAHAFWTKGWGGLAWHVVLGVLYIAFGIVLVAEPLSGSLILSYVLGLLLLLSGILRALHALSHWREAGWIMLLSGIFGIVAGLVILSGFPKTTFWVLGLLLGIDLMSHGAAWLTYGRSPIGRPV